MVLKFGGWRRRGLACAGLMLVATPIVAKAETGPGYAAILVDADSREVLYANGADLPRHPASITKIMTLFLTFDALSNGRLHLDDRVVMTRDGADQKPSRLGIRPGESLSVDQAIRVIAVKSANDVAVALADKIGGSEPAFAAMMTRRARSLGMRNTTFVNATGLPDAAHITTARDLAILSAALIRTYPRYYGYFSTEKFQYEKLVFANHNHLLGRMPGMDGIKTGYTVDAGFTLAASAVRNNHRMIAVVLGEPTAAARDRDVTALLDTGFVVEAGRAQGQQLSVAGLLAPIAHPAIRIALPGIDQGSGDLPPRPLPRLLPTPRAESAPRVRHPASSRAADNISDHDVRGRKRASHDPHSGSGTHAAGTAAHERHAGDRKAAHPSSTKKDDLARSDPQRSHRKPGSTAGDGDRARRNADRPLRRKA